MKNLLLALGYKFIIGNIYMLIIVKEDEIPNNIKFQQKIDFSDSKKAINYIKELLLETENQEGFDFIFYAEKNQ